MPTACTQDPVAHVDASYRTAVARGSSTRSHGAYGSGAVLVDPERFAALPRRAADTRGEAIRLCRTARRVGGVGARLRVYPGGHDRDTWLRGFGGQLRRPPAMATVSG